MPPEREQRMLCGLVSTLPDQYGEKCEQPADLHVLTRHPEHGTLHELLTCTYHYPTAIEAGKRIATHEIGLWCGLPGTRFDEEANVCVVDDSGTEPEKRL